MNEVQELFDLIAYGIVSIVIIMSIGESPVVSNRDISIQTSSVVQYSLYTGGI